MADADGDRRGSTRRGDAVVSDGDRRGDAVVSDGDRRGVAATSRPRAAHRRRRPTWWWVTLHALFAVGGWLVLQKYKLLNGVGGRLGSMTFVRGGVEINHERGVAATRYRYR